MTTNLDAILNYSPDELRSMTIRELKAVATELGRGTVPNASKMRKSDLKDHLLGIHNRQLQYRQTQALIATAQGASDSEVLLEALKEGRDATAQKLADLAARDLMNLVGLQTEAEMSADMNTRMGIFARIGAEVRRVSQMVFEGWQESSKTQSGASAATLLRDFRNEVRDFYRDAVGEANPADKNRIEFLFNHFDKDLTDVFGGKLREKQTADRQNAAKGRLERSEGGKDVEYMPWLQKSVETLQGVEKGVSVDWRDVVLALAIATGRRHAEIQCTGDFDLIEGESHKVYFKGQCKNQKRSRSLTKGLETVQREEREAFEILTLIPAHFVVSGLQYLEENEKREKPEDETFDAHKVATKAVNKKYSMAMSRWLKSDEFSIKDFRALYAQAAMKIAEQDDNIKDPELFIAKILGHDPDEVGGFDLSSVTNYQKFFVIDERPIIE